MHAEEAPQLLRRYRSDGWLSKDGIDGVGISYSSFMPRVGNSKTVYFINSYKEDTSDRRFSASHGKFAIRPTIVRRTIVGQAA